jgi:pyruvate-formate lyase
MITFNHLLNQKFLPEFLEGENRELFADYLKTWADLGIHHIQFNVADAQTLKEAQVNPEGYRDMVVRVAGFSAYFVDLPKGLQDSIIERTAHACF